MAGRSSRTPEPCLECGEETAIGSVFYSDRRRLVAPDGGPTYVCSMCVERLRVARGGAPLTDRELQTLLANGSMAAIRWGFPFGH